MSFKILNSGKLCIAPLLSWYEEAFDDASDSSLHPARSTWSDFFQCTWPIWSSKETIKTTEFFMEKNNAAIEWVLQEKKKRKEEEDGKDLYTITFSHFLPRIELLPARQL